MSERQDAAYTAARAAGPRAGDAAGAFDALHERHASALVRQAFLLCGSPGLARRSVARAFREAWRDWPAVAVDPDPAGWVRAAAHRNALAQWRHPALLRAVRRENAMFHVPPYDRELFDALLRLPLAHRAPLLLHDGLGLAIGDIAAEVEAGTAAASGRVRHAREALASRVPALREVPPGDLPRVTALLVRELAGPQPVAPPAARRLRRSCEMRSRCATAASLGLVAALAVAVFAAGTPGEERPVPPRHAPGGIATLAPERQPGSPRPHSGGTPRLASGVAAPLNAPSAQNDGPAPGTWCGETGPFAVRARALTAPGA